MFNIPYCSNIHKCILVFLMTRTLDLNFVDIVGIRVEP